MWHERLLIRPLTEKSWLIVSAMRRLVPGRGMGVARDIPLGCVRVHRFANVPDEDVLREWTSVNGPENDAWEHETGRTAVEQVLVLLLGSATMEFEEFMAGRTRNSTDREMEDEASACRRAHDQVWIRLDGSFNT